MATLQHIYDRVNQGLRSKWALIDPEDIELSDIPTVCKELEEAGFQQLLVGGSTYTKGGDHLDDICRQCRQYLKVPVVLFPGDTHMISSEAQSLLYLVLISGRNPDYLIGKHVDSAQHIKKSGLENIPTGYMLIDGLSDATVVSESKTKPIPASDIDTAVATAVAGQLLGYKLIYMDAGSGAKKHVSTEMIEAVKSQIDIPLIVGGGIRTPEMAREIYNAGADIIVIGTAIEIEHGATREFTQVESN